MARVLLVEDDEAIIDNLTAFLKKEGFDADAATGQKAALEKLNSNTYDILLLDISLKDGNGFSLCSAVKSNFNIPVIFLTASDDEYSVVAGFDVGADDYVTKPFRPRELVSRIKNVLRRANRLGTIIEYKGITVDTEKGIVMKNGRSLFLSALEYRLLLLLFSNKGAILSRNKLLEEIWDVAGEFVNDNTLTVYIKRLREKIGDDPQNPEIILTVRGLGYKVGE
jgi:two-component system response regulator RegX3